MTTASTGEPQIDLARFSRQIQLAEIGLNGQEKLNRASVLLVGAGGLGSPAAYYLAAAGIGHIGIIDGDRVDVTNLHRQILHHTPDVGRAKVDSAADKLVALNPSLRIERFPTHFTAGNAWEIASRFDLLVDGADNFATRYLVNDVCVLQGKPNCYASIFQFEGQASVFALRGHPCYRCLYPQPPDPDLIPNCAAAGVLGVLPGIMGLIQATEAIKLLLGIGDSLAGRLLTFDALEMRFRELRIVRNRNCPVCGDQPTIRTLIDYDSFCRSHVPTASVAEITPAELFQLQQSDPERFLLIDVREPHEYAICNLAGRLIPLGALRESLIELPRNIDLILHCKSGARSEKGVKLLRDHGFTRVKHLRGGILAWREQIDPSLPSY